MRIHRSTAVADEAHVVPAELRRARAVDREWRDVERVAQDDRADVVTTLEVGRAEGSVVHDGRDGDLAARALVDVAAGEHDELRVGPDLFGRHAMRGGEQYLRRDHRCGAERAAAALAMSPAKSAITAGYRRCLCAADDVG